MMAGARVELAFTVGEQVRGAVKRPALIYQEIRFDPPGKVRIAHQGQGRGRHDRPPCSPPPPPALCSSSSSHSLLQIASIQFRNFYCASLTVHLLVGERATGTLEQLPAPTSPPRRAGPGARLASRSLVRAPRLTHSFARSHLQASMH